MGKKKGFFARLFGLQRGKYERMPHSEKEKPEPKNDVLPKPQPPKESAKQEPKKPLPLKSESHKVAGVTHYLSAFYALREENDDYKMSKREIIENGMTDERIWQYDFPSVKAELFPEPDNPKDPNAIKVVVDGHHIGYIKSGSCAHVHNLIKSGRIEKIYVEMGGGLYKRISFDDCDVNGKEVYTSDSGTAPYFAKITIFTAAQ